MSGTNRARATEDATAHKFRLRTEKCATCLYALKYDRATRERILGDVEASDGYVRCHSHDLRAHVCCRGYWDAVRDRGGTPVQIAWRLDRMGLNVVEAVGPGMYPRPDDGGDEEGDDPFERE